MQAPSLAPYAALPSTLANDEEKKKLILILISKWQR
jgi:hypothetical protein